MSVGWRDESGQILPLVAIVIVVTVGMLLLAVQIGTDIDTRARARTAADAAALAGAAEGERAARRLAAANGADLIEYEQIGTVVTVVVRIGSALAEARAEAAISFERG